MKLNNRDLNRELRKKRLPFFPWRRIPQFLFATAFPHRTAYNQIRRLRKRKRKGEAA